LKLSLSKDLAPERAKATQALTATVRQLLADEQMLDPIYQVKVADAAEILAGKPVAYIDAEARSKKINAKQLAQQILAKNDASRARLRQIEQRRQELAQKIADARTEQEINNIRRDVLEATTWIQK
jgi:hypothetical protein